MPGFDGTGPAGRGPMTGRGRGFCILTTDEGAGSARKMVGFAGAAGIPMEVSPDYLKEEGYAMPRGDGTGPAGMGPMTGRAAGYCAGYGMPGYMNPIPGRRAAYPGVPYGAPPYGRPGTGYMPPAYYGLAYYRGGFGRGFGRGMGWGRGRGGRGSGFGRGFQW